MVAAISVNFPVEKLLELFAENVFCALTVEGTIQLSVLQVVLGDNEFLNFHASPIFTPQTGRLRNRPMPSPLSHRKRSSEARAEEADSSSSHVANCLAHELGRLINDVLLAAANMHA